MQQLFVPLHSLSFMLCITTRNELWPNKAARLTKSTPASAILVAKVCRKSYKTKDSPSR
jgi:hypothetical protein